MDTNDIREQEEKEFYEKVNDFGRPKKQEDNNNDN